jgi:hypothetical protein
MLAACVLSGVAGLLESKTWSTAVTNTLPEWQVVAWYTGLLACGAVSFAGAVARGVTSLLVERFGLSMLGGWTLLYSVVVVMQAGVRGLFVALLVAAFAAASVARVVQITRDLRPPPAQSATSAGGRPGGER